MPGKRPSFTLPVEPISPPPERTESQIATNALGVEAPGTAPGSEKLISTPFIAIAATSAAMAI